MSDAHWCMLSTIGAIMRGPHHDGTHIDVLSSLKFGTKTRAPNIAGKIWARVLRTVFGLDAESTVSVSPRASLRGSDLTRVHVEHGVEVHEWAKIYTLNYTTGSHEDVWIRRGTIVGPCAVIHPGSNIGSHCVIMSGSVVSGSVPDCHLAYGDPLVCTVIDPENLKALRERERAS